MYKHYETSDDVFVDREEHIEWMNEALERCKERSVVLHLKGIGGIGKSSLLNHWVNTHEKSIRLDCYQYSDFFQRLNILAKGAVLQGIKLHRFDILWQIRQRFVEGVEPVKEDGREWAKEVVMAIPFIGSLASIGSAINAIGMKVTPKLKGKYGTVGKWLQEQLGKNHIEELLEILWKEPRRAEFLYLSALVEDINTRENLSIPVLFLFDHFEHVDDDKTLWKYRKKRINETELWTIFLSNLSNGVGVLASRKPAAMKKEVEIEESELLELDRDSCFEMLELQDVVDKELQEQIVSVSGGNPFVIDAICDMINTSDVSMSDIESFRADDLAEVRLKVWRRLFNQAEGLHALINRAGIVPYFDDQIMSIIAPEMTPDSWDRLRHLSFVREREDKTYVLHELAEDLVKAELGGKLKSLALDVGGLLEKASEEKTDYKLLGLALSVQGLHSPQSAIQKIADISNNLSWRFQFRSAVEFHDSIRFETLREQTIVSSLKAWHLAILDRVAEAEHLLTEALDFFENLTEVDPNRNQIHLMCIIHRYAYLLYRIKQPVEAQTMFERALQISKNIDPSIGMNYQDIAFLYNWYSIFLMDIHQLNKASELLRQALELFELGTDQVIVARNRVFTLNKLAYVLVFAGKIDEAETIFADVLETKTEDVNELNSLTSLGDIYRLTSRPLEAEHMFRSSLELIRKISKREEGVHQVQPTSGLRHYALSLKLIDNYSEAEYHYKEALKISKESVTETPEVYLPSLSMVLNDFAILYYEMSQYSKAGEFYEEALENYERLSRDWPDRYEKDVAWTLNNYSILLRESGEREKARKFYHRALGIGRELAQKYPENIFHSHLLGTVLNNLGVFHRKNGEKDEAEEVLREALEVKQALAEKTPEIYLSSVATTLNNLGVVLSITNRQPEALEVSEQGLEIRRDLVKKSPEMHNGRLGFVLNNLGNIYKISGEHSKAEEYYQEALDILDNLVVKAPSVYQRYVTMILSNLLLYHSQQAATEKADSIRRRLEKLGSIDIPDQEVWIEEEDTEADAF